MVETPHTKTKPAAKCGDLQARDTCAQMTVSLQTVPKCRQHGLTFIPTGWTTGIKGSSNFVQGLEGQVHTHTVNVRADSVFNKPKILQNFGHLSSMFLSKGLTCYTDVESNGRDASYQNQTGCQMCDLQARDTHARADDGLKPHAPKKCRHTV
jgi:hypothetical protein